jgi:outer membrane protein assembly factor BamB
VADYFTPFNWPTLNTEDWDLGSALASLLPTFSGSFPHVLIGAGKEGRIYVVNRDNMGKHSTNGTDNQIIQSIPLAVGGTTTPRNFSTPAYWNGNIFFVGSNDRIKQFKLNTSTGKLSSKPFASGPEVYGFPGGQPVVSANAVGSGIVWAVQRAGVLRAYDATNVGRELYNSSQNQSRDALVGTATKFAPVLAVNGRVYVGTHDHLLIYGLL